MLYQTTQEHEAFRQKMRGFAESEVKPIAFMLDQNNEFPAYGNSLSEGVRRGRA